MQAPRWFWRWVRIGPRVAYALGLGPLLGRFVLLLTTTGRRTGRRRVTPLVYQEAGGRYLVASARGLAADWIRNIAVDDRVEVRVGRLRFDGRAEIIQDVEEIAGYLLRQHERNPKAFGAILRLEGLPSSPSLAQLEELAASRPMVAIDPAPSR